MSYDRAVEQALERKQDPTEYLNWKTREPEPVECEECEHPISMHEAQYGCEYERGDTLVGEVLVARGPCSCRKHVAETDKLQLALRREYEALNHATT